ncbi:MAG TPA: YdcF family protein [Candidatus Limnocylindrales bacterium]|nr:YdcF family protein [Candidatus Limnocylindrales bacterium]
MDTGSSPAKSRYPVRRRIVLFSLLVLAAGATLAFRHAGRWLIREDPLAHADAIVVLSGSMPYRAEGAAQIFRGGFAPEIWVSRPENPAPELKEIGVAFKGEEEYNREVLTHEGVPDSAIKILPRTIVDTEEEIEEVTQRMRAEELRSVIIVTSPQHTRRVHALWKKLGGKNQQVIVRAAPADPFEADHWWRNTRDSLAVVREYLGLLNVWLGLPVRPHPR